MLYASLFTHSFTARLLSIYFILDPEVGVENMGKSKTQLLVLEDFMSSLDTDK